MDRLDRHWMFATKRHLAWRLATFIAVLAVWGVANRNALATPMTLAFDANITDVFSSQPPNLPFLVGPGDIVHSNLTVDPNAITQSGPNTGRADQPFTIQFNFHSNVLSSTQFTISTFDNSFISDTETHGLVDQIVVECSSSRSLACQPTLNTSSINQPFGMYLALGLTGGSSIFDGPTLSADPGFWNSFALDRSFSLTVTDQSGVGVSILGTLGDFTATPEPSTLFSTLEAIFIIGLICGSRGRDPQQLAGRVTRRTSARNCPKQ